MPTCVFCPGVWSSLGVLGVSVGQTVTIDPVGAVTVVEGNNLTINCTDHGANMGNDFSLFENAVHLTGGNAPPSELIGTARIFQLPVDRTKNGNTYRCQDLVGFMMSAVLNLTVTCEWRVGSGYKSSYYSLVFGLVIAARVIQDQCQLVFRFDYSQCQ